MLGRWLGVTDHIGNGLTYKVINANAEVLSRSTVISLSKEELENTDIQRQIKDLDNSIAQRIGTYEKARLSDEDKDGKEIYLNLFEGDEDPHPDHTMDFFQDGDTPDADDGRSNDILAEEIKDRYLGAKVLLPQGGKMLEAKVMSRKRTSDGKTLVRTQNPNPLLDTRLYQVEFPDGGVGEFTTNAIAESLYSNVDKDGYDLGLLDGKYLIENWKMQYVRKMDGMKTMA